MNMQNTFGGMYTITSRFCIRDVIGELIGTYLFFVRLILCKWGQIAKCRVALHVLNAGGLSTP